MTKTTPKFRSVCRWGIAGVLGLVTVASIAFDAAAQQQLRLQRSSVDVDWSVLDELDSRMPAASSRLVPPQPRAAARRVPATATTAAPAPRPAAAPTTRTASTAGSSSAPSFATPAAPPTFTDAPPAPRAAPATPNAPTQLTRPPTPPSPMVATAPAPQLTPPPASSQPAPAAAAPSAPPPPPAPMASAPPPPPAMASAPPPASPAPAPAPMPAPQAAAPAPAPAVPQVAALPPATQPVEGNLGRIDFAANAAELPAGGRGALDRAVAEMKRDENTRLQIVAYATGGDESGSQARRLSLSRALAVRSYLIDQGIRSTRMDVRALGSRAPEGPADRVDIVLVRR